MGRQGTSLRLEVLAAVAALPEFTVAEVWAYTSTNREPSVREAIQSLQRRGWLTCRMPPSDGRAGRMPLTYSLRESRRDQLLAEMRAIEDRLEETARKR